LVSSVTLETIARIEHHERCVSALAFSADGTRLLSVAGDSDHMLALWDWEGNQHEPLVEYPGGKEEIFGVRFAPHTNAEFVSYGVKHLR
jgi:hypothetical protein